MGRILTPKKRMIEGMITYKPASKQVRSKNLEETPNLYSDPQAKSWILGPIYIPGGKGLLSPTSISKALYATKNALIFEELFFFKILILLCQVDQYTRYGRKTNNVDQ